MSERKLRAWHDAGLVDEATVARILAYEETQSRPLALWAAMGIGALAIGLGLISIIAANWEDVPGTVRLAIHLALLITAGGFIARQAQLEHNPHGWMLEGALFVFAALGLTFFGHLGQVYQTGSPLWKPLAAWLVLFAPILLVRGQSWLIAAALFGAFSYMCWDYTYNLDLAGSASNEWMAFITAVPVLLAVLAAWMRRRDTREVFWKRLEQLALTYAAAGALLVAIFAGIEPFHREPDFLSMPQQFIRAGVAGAAGVGVAMLRGNTSGRMTGAILLGAGLVFPASYLVSGSEFMAGAVFMAFSVGIAAAALKAGWRGVFQAAIAIIALRLIILSFELASDLLTSGFGLIIAGLLILGVAWVAVRISREYAPPAESDV